MTRRDLLFYIQAWLSEKRTLGLYDFYLARVPNIITKLNAGEDPLTCARDFLHM